MRSRRRILARSSPHQYRNRRPTRLLNPEKDKVDSKGWTLASFIRLAGLPVSAADF
jgi:hypothetical protein